MNEQFGELVSYIKQHLSQGVPAADIRQVLLQYNWSPELVEQAFQQAQAPVQAPFPTVEAPTAAGPAGSQAAPAKYGVFKAIGDTFRAIAGNFGAIILSALISLAVSIVLIAGLGLVTASLIHASASIGSIVVVVILWLVALAFISSFLLSTFALTVYEGSEGRHSAIGQVLSRGFKMVGRLVGANLLFYLILTWPLLLALILGIVMALAGHGVTTSFTIVMIGVGLGSVVWAMIASLRYALVPFVVLFEPEVALTKAFKRSQYLLSNGGQWFIFKGLLLDLALTILVAALSGQSVSQANGSPSVILQIVSLVVSVLAMGVLVLLYRNRRLVKGNG